MVTVDCLEPEPAAGRKVESDGTDPWVACSFCGIIATAACPQCDAQQGGIWARSAPEPELEEYPYPS